MSIGEFSHQAASNASQVPYRRWQIKQIGARQIVQGTRDVVKRGDTQVQAENLPQAIKEAGLQKWSERGAAACQEEFDLNQCADMKGDRKIKLHV